MWKAYGVSREGYPQGLYLKKGTSHVLVIPDFVDGFIVIADEDGEFEYEVNFKSKDPLREINKYLIKEGLPKISKSDFIKGFTA